MRWIGWLGLFVFVLAACGQLLGSSSSSSEPPPDPTRPAATASSDADDLFSAEEPPPGAHSEFKTDFTRHNVPYSEILSGGPPKDGIPAIDEPSYTNIDEADGWLAPQEPVVLLTVGNAVRAYPLQILMWHEIVNDELGGVPIVVTFCPLCNTAIAFERAFDEQVLDFGTTGRLRFSNLIMYDRQTETWWQQATGEAIAGRYTGSELVHLPASMISWASFRDNYPKGDVLSRETGFSRNYGQNPYAGYDNINLSPFLYDGLTTPGTLPPMARVLTIDLNGEAVAYPYDVMQELYVVNDEIGGIPIVLFWAPGTASALDTGDIALGRDVGAVTAYSRELDGQVLSWRYRDGTIVDDGTQSEWDHLGRATSGPMAGSELAPVVGINHFWFSWAAFRPNTRVYQP